MHAQCPQWKVGVRACEVRQVACMPSIGSVKWV